MRMTNACSTRISFVVTKLAFDRDTSVANRKRVRISAFLDPNNCKHVASSALLIAL